MEKDKALSLLYATDEYIGGLTTFIVLLVISKNVWVSVVSASIVGCMLWLFTQPPEPPEPPVVEEQKPKPETKVVFTPPPAPIKLRFGEVALTSDYKINILEDSTFILSLKGYGKTVLLYNILNQIHKHFNPEKVQVCIVDFKEVSLRWTKNSPFLFTNQVYTTGRGIDVVNAELIRRKKLYSSVSSDIVCDNINKYNKVTNSKLPVLLLIVDEVQEATDETKELLTRINKVGRSLGILVMAATQRSTSESVSRAFISQFRHRMVGFNVTKTEYKLAGIKDEDTISKMRDSKGLFAISTGSKWDVIQTDFVSTEAIEALARTFKPKRTVLEGNEIERNTQVLRYFTTLGKKPKISEVVTHYDITEDDARKYLRLWKRR